VAKDVLIFKPIKTCRIGDLSILYAALSERTCHWVQLTPENDKLEKLTTGDGWWW